MADHHGNLCRQLSGPVAHRFDGVDHTVEDDGAITLDEGHPLVFHRSGFGRIERSA